jgi:hypothetical protein
VADPQQASRRQGVWSSALLAVVIVLQIGLVAWWLWVPMPNASNVRPNLPARRRVQFLLSAIPHVVPGVTARASGLGGIANQFRHFERLTQRIPIVLAALLIGFAGLGIGEIGMRLLRIRGELSRWERLPLAFGLGMIGLGAGTLVFGRLGLLNPWLIRGILLVLAGLGVGLGRGGSSLDSGGRTTWKPFVLFALVAGPFVVLMGLASMCPTWDYDAMEYHLQGPKEYAQNGKISFLSHNIYTSMPFGVEMIHLLGMIVMGDWWRGALAGQLVVMLHAPAAAAMVGFAANRLASPRAGWLAALIYLTTPWIYRMAAIPYVEGPLMFYHAAAIWALIRDREPRWWAVIGLMAGGAMSCKYPALISAVIPFGLLALTTRSPKAVGAFILGVTVAIGPWLFKNVIDTGNPVYPLGFHVFGGSPWNEAREIKWQNVHGPRPHARKDLTDGILDIAGRSDWQTILFAALGPLAFLRRGSRRSSFLLLAFVVFVFGTWYVFTHRLDRFWLPAVPALAILAGLGADWTRSRSWSIWLGILIGVVTASNFFYATSALTAVNEWTSDLDTLPREVPRLLNPALASMDELLPPEARPLLVGQAAVFHLRHRVVYNTVFDDEILETIARDQTPAEVRKRLLDRAITHIFVDWPEVERHRKLGGYGFTAWVQPDVFSGLVKAGVLERMQPPGPRHDLFRVVPR